MFGKFCDPSWAEHVAYGSFQERLMVRAYFRMLSFIVGPRLWKFSGSYLPAPVDAEIKTTDAKATTPWERPPFLEYVFFEGTQWALPLVLLFRRHRQRQAVWGEGVIWRWGSTTPTRSRLPSYDRAHVIRGLRHKRRTLWHDPSALVRHSGTVLIYIVEDITCGTTRMIFVQSNDLLIWCDDEGKISCKITGVGADVDVRHIMRHAETESLPVKQQWRVHGFEMCEWVRQAVIYA